VSDVESQVRERMQPGEHLGPQWPHEKDLAYDAEADVQDFMNALASKRRANYVGYQTVHQYRTSPK
jgi:hypothetical protein